MTVPVGSCTGTAVIPTPMSKGRDSHGRMTGICPLCTGRFRLGADGRLPNHAAAPALTR
jgi:hypothetical protein